MSVSSQLVLLFKKAPSFSLKDAYEAVPEHPEHAIRARIYEGIRNGQFTRLSRGVFAVAYEDPETKKQSQCILLNGDGRNLSFLPDNSVDCIMTDHPYDLKAQLKGGSRDFATYELFQYTAEDFKEKFRVLKPGCFLCEFIPEESATNFEYLTRIKNMALEAGFEYYAKVPWIKGSFVANTGRKSKNSEDILLMTKGPARSLRPDAKKDKAEPGTVHYMKGAAGMLPAAFNFDPPSRGSRIHQAEKPVALIRKVLEYVTLAGELVLDQFAGSGSTGEACLLSGRDCILMEKDRGFAANIAERLGMEPVTV